MGRRTVVPGVGSRGAGSAGACLRRSSVRNANPRRPVASRREAAKAKDK